jgi:hypothetical protein
VASQITRLFTSENGVSPEERGASTEPFVIAQAAPGGPKQFPWSKYVPFPKGTELLVEGSVAGGKVFGQDLPPFKGSGKIEELTDAKLEFSVTFVGDPTISIRAAIAYAAEGSGNAANFTIKSFDQKTITDNNIEIRSTSTERVLTKAGGIKIPTGVPVIEEVTMNAMHLVPTKDRIDITADMGFPIPPVTIKVSKKPPKPG